MDQLAAKEFGGLRVFSGPCHVEAPSDLHITATNQDTFFDPKINGSSSLGVCSDIRRSSAWLLGGPRHCSCASLISSAWARSDRRRVRHKNCDRRPDSRCVLGSGAGTPPHSRTYTVKKMTFLRLQAAGRLQKVGRTSSVL